MEPKESKSNKHFQMSLVKSLIRILGCGFLAYGEISLAGICLLVGEVFGIFEEL